ncbi:GNAT family N-acetyltransferase [Colwellia sp. TT2012]|uniref:GNAT family N-acetyltransferase n=1 Tax=Colwellia sp. TT2012 TaxID=1720342 RepID=UPI00070917CF|nr:GNAT family N-acetyltransferase [Colwellia sp. TT2012]
MLIRVANKDDLSIIAGLLVETQKAHVAAYPMRYIPLSLCDAKLSLLERLDSPGFIVAELDSCVVGYAVYNIVVTEQTTILRVRQYCYLQQIGVDVQKRGSGIGHVLIEHVKNECHKQGVNDIELDVWAFNAGGQKFFEKSGFEPYGFKLNACISSQ